MLSSQISEWTVGVQEPPGPEEDINFYAQSLVLIGNLLYEQSQITAAVNHDGWKDMVRANLLDWVLATLMHLHVVNPADLPAYAATDTARSLVFVRSIVLVHTT